LKWWWCSLCTILIILVGLLRVLAHWSNIPPRIDKKKHLNSNISVKYINRWLWTLWICLYFLRQLTVLVNTSISCGDVDDDRLTKYLDMTSYWMLSDVTNRKKRQKQQQHSILHISDLNYMILWYSSVDCSLLSNHNLRL